MKIFSKSSRGTDQQHGAHHIEFAEDGPYNNHTRCYGDGEAVAL